METHGPLGTIWASLGLISFYLALIWINLILLPMIISSMFSLLATTLVEKKPKQPAI